MGLASAASRSLESSSSPSAGATSSSLISGFLEAFVTVGAKLGGLDFEVVVTSFKAVVRDFDLGALEKPLGEPGDPLLINSKVRGCHGACFVPASGLSQPLLG